MGYHLAGFDVVGVDIEPQPRYPFTFVQADALTFLRELDYGVLAYAAIHASPPCQAHTSLKIMANAREHIDLIAPTREALGLTGIPWTIENVVGAPLVNPTRLCGTSFGLGVPSLDRELRRHRLFETSWHLGLAPPCGHRRRACGIYGDHFRLGRRSSDGEFSGERALAYGSEAMGIDWMTWPELKEAIPPDYTRFLGGLMPHG